MTGPREYVRTFPSRVEEYERRGWAVVAVISISESTRVTVLMVRSIQPQPHWQEGKR